MRRYLIARLAAGAAVAVAAALPLQAQVTELYEGFENLVDGGPIGKIPAGWLDGGYGFPMWTEDETGLKTQGGHSYRYNYPNPNPDSGISGIHQADISVDSMVSQAIDWNFPVTISIDVYAADYSIGGKWQTLVDMQGYTGTFFVDYAGYSEDFAEWGDDGIPNAQWVTVGKVLDPGQSGLLGNIAVMVDFDQPGIFDQNAALFDNLTISYVPIPGTLSLLALGGLAVMRRRR